ncbi:hypothetical protein GW17_00017039 [Ensete ventricosum]|nr:hypothetical protein GW17_00017039 [Ensete ventricosum]
MTSWVLLSSPCSYCVSLSLCPLLVAITAVAPVQAAALRATTSRISLRATVPTSGRCCPWVVAAPCELAEGGHNKPHLQGCWPQVAAPLLTAFVVKIQQECVEQFYMI